MGARGGGENGGQGAGSYWPKNKLHKIAFNLLMVERAYVARLHLLDQVLMWGGG